MKRSGLPTILFALGALAAIGGVMGAMATFPSNVDRILGKGNFLAPLLLLVGGVTYGALLGAAGKALEVLEDIRNGYRPEPVQVSYNVGESPLVGSTRD
jgi:membrane associated rhomboid family serine protease